MKLELKPEVGGAYKAAPQRVRAITEAWGRENLYCAACDSDSLESERPGKPVFDFTCGGCSERYQLKARGAAFGGSVKDAAYAPFAEAVVAGTAPSLFLLRYDPKAWRVEGLLLVPRFFLTLSAIIERPPLGPSARRSGHILCDIALARLPPDGRIDIVRDARAEAPEAVRAAWSRFAFLKDARHEVRGWTADVLAQVRGLSSMTFTLRDFYEASEGTLSALHPKNLHIRAKIRQQLQVLRDRGIVEFLGRGRYRQVRWCQKCGHDLVPNALPRDGSGHRRLACPNCGAWLWE